MKTNIFKMNEKQYKAIKELSDKDFGKLIRAECEYVYSAKLTDTKDKLLNLYLINFKDRVDEERFYQETGRLGGIKSFENKNKEKNGIAISVDVLKKSCLDEMIDSLLSSLENDSEEDDKDEVKN